MKLRHEHFGNSWRAEVRFNCNRLAVIEDKLKFVGGFIGLMPTLELKVHILYGSYGLSKDVVFGSLLGFRSRPRIKARGSKDPPSILEARCSSMLSSFLLGSWRD